MRLYNNENMTQTFDNFYIDNSNNLACKIIRNITLNKKIKSFPILIIGKSGVGKSHLMNALENSIKDKAKVIKISSDDFIQDDSIINYKNEDIAVLIIEDIQFLSSKIKVQKKLYDILRKMKEKNTKIILTAGVEKLYLKELNFIKEMNYKNFNVIEIRDNITRETKKKIIQDYAIINSIELSSSEVYLLNIANNTFVELKNKLNAIKLVKNIQIKRED